jgi:3-hydroxyisobutyrate dehydrogenase
MAARLLDAGHRLTVYNRTRSKTEELAGRGARVADDISELGGCDVVFVTVASSDDLLSVLSTTSGLLSAEQVPGVVVDCSTVSADASHQARVLAAKRGVDLLAAPVSGNPKVARSGRLTMVVSGPRAAFEQLQPYLEVVTRSATYVGEGEESRLVKLCHNLLLGVVIQSLAEITVLAERAGVQRHDFLTFLNDSVMGSMFTRYKSPALVNLDFKPTFTTKLLHKDFDLGLAAARSLGVPMPVAGLVHQLLQDAIGNGIGDMDFAALLSLVARGAGMALEPEDAAVDDGLGMPVAREPLSPDGARAVEPASTGARTGGA